MIYVFLTIISATIVIIGLLAVMCIFAAGDTPIKFGIIILTSSVILTISIYQILMHGVHYNTGGGTHLGYISSTETTGIIYKTPRAYFKTSLRSSQEDQYCIENMNLYKKLSNLQNENVLITYKSYLVNGIKICAGEDAIITGFKVISH